MIYKKDKVGNDQEMAQSERIPPIGSLRNRWTVCASRLSLYITARPSDNWYSNCFGFVKLLVYVSLKANLDYVLFTYVYMWKIYHLN